MKSFVDNLSEEGGHIANDVVAAYGDRALAFVDARIQDALHQRHRFPVLNFWTQVGSAVEALAVEPSLGWANRERSLLLQ